jgi:prefoldin subunit 5
MGLIEDLRAGPIHNLDHARDLMAQSADEIEQLRADKSRYSDEVSRLSVELDRTNQEIGGLTNELDQARDEIAKLKADRALVANEVTRLNTEAIVANSDMARLTGELTQVRNDIARLRDTEKKVPAARKDLIRRLVAVAISVGFASQIVLMNVFEWWTQGAHLGDPQAAQLARLITGMLVILLGWDWYDRDVEDKPLTRIARFILDAVIVITQLLLLLSSGDSHLWSRLLVAVFALYVVWDILAIVDHPSAFARPSPRSAWWHVPKDVGYAYIGGLGRDEKNHGPLINVVWLAYFYTVLLVLPFPGKYGAFAQCLMVALGACLLWGEGVRRNDGRRLISWWGRLLGFIALGVLYMAYRCTLSN